MNSSSRLSSSVLWELQRRAYTQFGIESWTRKGVPFHITNNSLFAQQYAQIALPLCKRGSITFLELGAGCGKFAYLFLSELLAQGVALDSVRYVLTDFSEKNVAFYKTHPHFASWIQKGIVVPLVYDPLTQHLPSDSPDFVIANYFFDTMPPDLFKVDKGELFEGIVEVAAGEGTDFHDPDVIEKLSLNYSYRKIPQGPYFDSDLEPFFRFYLDQISDGIFLFPSSGLSVLRRLFSIAKRPFILLAADRGIETKEEATTQAAPGFKIHGTFSFPVNCHALAQFFIYQGGKAYFPKESAPQFKVGLFSSGEIANDVIKTFVHQKFGPLKTESSSLLECLNHLKQANWDATLFFSYFEKMENWLFGATKAEKALFIEAALKIKSRFFPLNRKEGYLLGLLAFCLEDLGEPAEATQLSQMAQLFQEMEDPTKDPDVLQIGALPPHSDYVIIDSVQIPISLEALEPLGMFDLILFSSSYNKPSEAPKIGFLQDIEHQFPHLNQRIYTDDDLNDFFSQLDAQMFARPKYFVQFFVSMKERGQISLEQLNKSLERLEQEGFISAFDRSQLTIAPQSIDYWPVFYSALKEHLKKGGVLKAFFPASFSDQRMFDEVIVDPYLDYKEEYFCPGGGEELLVITIKKL